MRRECQEWLDPRENPADKSVSNITSATSHPGTGVDTADEDEESKEHIIEDDQDIMNTRSFLWIMRI